MISAYIIHLLILVGIYLLLTIAMQLTLGYTGLLNLAHISFFGIGAYVSVILSQNGISYIGALLISALIAMLFGAAITWPVRNLKGDYLALVTIGFSFLVYAVLINWTSLTQGPLGIAGIPKPEIFGWKAASSGDYLLLIAVIVGISLFILYRVVKSPFGQVMSAVRDDESAARAIGKNVFGVKMRVLALSAFFAGIAGSLYAHYIGFIDPDSFTLLQMGPILTIVLIGGLASGRGTILAAIIITLLPEPIRFIGLPASIAGPVRQLLYGLLIIIILMFKPRGFWGKVKLE